MVTADTKAESFNCGDNIRLYGYMKCRSHKDNKLYSGHKSDGVSKPLSAVCFGIILYPELKFLHEIARGGFAL